MQARAHRHRAGRGMADDRPLSSQEPIDSWLSPGGELARRSAACPHGSVEFGPSLRGERPVSGVQATFDIHLGHAARSLGFSVIGA